MRSRSLHLTGTGSRHCCCYESLTASRDEKRATLSPLLQAITVAYWGCFNDRICPSCPLLQLSLCTLPRGFTGRASTTPLKLVPFGHYPEMRWQALWTMDNNKDCTKLHCSSYMIYSLSFREGELHGEQHVYWHCCSCTVPLKIDRVANIRNSLLPVRKMSKSTVKNGRLQNFFSPILSITLLDTTLQ